MPHRVSRFWFVILFLVATSPALQTSQAPAASLEILDEDTIAEHRISPIPPVRVAPGTPVDFYADRIVIEVTVNERGQVTSARPLPPEASRHLGYEHPIALEALDPSAVAQAKTVKYRPFLRNGQPVPARFQELVRILPFEMQPETHLPFPPVRDWDSLTIVLERKYEPTHYRVEIHGDGSVVYSASCRNHFGFAGLVTAKGRLVTCIGAPLIIGEHHDHISRGTVLQLVEAFRRADFFSLSGQYTYKDLPILNTVSISYDGNRKSVGEAYGEVVRMPQAVTNLEQDIDDAVGIRKWTVGNGETVPSLMREGWDFKSREAAQTLVRAVSLLEFTSVAADLVNAGVDANLEDEEEECTLYYAALYGDEKLINLLLRAGVGKRHYRCQNRALLLAAERGRLQMVRSLVVDGADVRFKGDEDFFSQETLLMAAAKSGNPEVVAEALKYHPSLNARDNAAGFAALKNTALMFASARSQFPYKTSDDKEADERGKPTIVAMLLKAGANPQVHDNEGNTALHYAGFPAVARLLIASGADINARDHDGETPLMLNESAEVTKVLLQAGANPSATDKEGHTALWLARDRLEHEIDTGLGAFINHDRKANLREKMRILESWTPGSLSQNR